MISFKHPTPPEPNRKIRKLIDAEIKRITEIYV